MGFSICRSIDVISHAAPGANSGSSCAAMQQAAEGSTDPTPRQPLKSDAFWRRAFFKKNDLEKNLQSWHDNIIDVARAERHSDESIAVIKNDLKQVMTIIKNAQKKGSAMLDLSDYSLPWLPDLSRLKKLTHLIVQGKNLEELPGFKQLPPHLTRMEILAPPLSGLPASYGSFKGINSWVYDAENGRLTIGMQSPPGETGKTISLEFLVCDARADWECRGVEPSYTFIKSLPGFDNAISENGVMAQNHLNSESFFDRPRAASDEISFPEPGSSNSGMLRASEASSEIDSEASGDFFVLESSSPNSDTLRDSAASNTIFVLEPSSRSTETLLDELRKNIADSHKTSPAPPETLLWDRASESSEFLEVESIVAREKVRQCMRDKVNKPGAEFILNAILVENAR